MTFRTHTLGFVSVEQAGAWGEPTHWRIKRNGQLVGTAPDETNALTIGLALAQHGSGEWIALRKLAASLVGRGETEQEEQAA